MKSLRFKSLQLLSTREKKARRIDFHPNRNLILGLNHVGKSTVTKQIFETLGAAPAGKLQDWDPSTIALLTATVGEEDFLFLRQLKHRAIFDSNGELLAAFATNGEWANALSEFMEFNLVLTGQDDKIVTGDAACMFLPFYINQDEGWTSKWQAFNGLSRFRRPTSAIIEYFTQVVPPRYYIAKASAEAEQRAIVALNEELRILNKTRDRLSKSLPTAGPHLTAEAFEVEIRELTRQLTEVNRQQEIHRLEQLSLQDSLLSIDHQIALTTDTLKRFGEDFDYLSQPVDNEFVCPTCDAHHKESFLSILMFAEDARAVSDMLVQLQQTRRRIVGNLEKALSERSNLSGQYADLQAILDIKRGDIKLSDVINSIGSGAALIAFDNEDRELEQTRNGHLIRKHQLDLDMKALRSQKRKKEITKFFRTTYALARTKLNLSAIDIKKASIAKRPDLSGSGGPRDVLAYYAALWWVSRSAAFDSPFSLPIIVDCPAQSGQDAINLPAMLEFISNGLPKDAQVLVTHESDVEDEFDRRILLDKPYSLLLEAEYDQIAETVLGKVDMMQRTLLQNVLTN